MTTPTEPSKNRLAVVTSVFGCRDALKEPSHIRPGVDYICFTDDPQTSSKSWDVRLVPVGDPIYQTKDYKIRTHVHLPEYEFILWLDASFKILELGPIFASLEIDDASRQPFLGLLKHPQRKCIYDEAERARRAHKEHPERLDRVVAQYKAEGHPPNWGLYCGGVLLRKRCPENSAFGDAWFQAVVEGSNRDQLSLPVVLRRLEVDFTLLPRGVPCTKMYQHLKKPRRATRPVRRVRRR